MKGVGNERQWEGSHLHPEQGSLSFVKGHARNIIAASGQRRGTILPPSQARPSPRQVLLQTPLAGPGQEPSKYQYLGMSPLGRYSLGECPRTNQATGVQWKLHCALHVNEGVNMSSEGTELGYLSLQFRSPIFEMSTPSISILPSVASRIRNKASKKEDFPLPVRPQMPTFSFAF